MVPVLFDRKGLRWISKVRGPQIQNGVGRSQGEVEMWKGAGVRLIGRVLTVFALAASIVVFVAPPAESRVINFTLGELLGRPTDTSITVNVVPAETVDIYVE